jgi:hypothetical protein
MLPSPDRRSDTHKLKWALAILSTGILLTADNLNYVALTLLGLVVLHEIHIYAKAFAGSDDSRTQSRLLSSAVKVAPRPPQSAVPASAGKAIRGNRTRVSDRRWVGSADDHGAEDGRQEPARADDHVGPEHARRGWRPTRRVRGMWPRRAPGADSRHAVPARCRGVIVSSTGRRRCRGYRVRLRGAGRRVRSSG